MSFQAYLDNIEAKTGKTPKQLIALAKKQGFDGSSKAGDIVAWLKEDFNLGRGHAMAVVHIIKNGTKIGEKHVGSKGVHRDASSTLRLDGKDKKSSFPKISAPALRALANANIKTLRQLTKHTQKEIVDLHGMGPKALSILKKELKSQGLSFKGA